MLALHIDYKPEDESYNLKDSISNKEKYIPWQGSPFWIGNLELKQFEDAPMNLIFIGVTKSTKTNLQIYLAE